MSPSIANRKSWSWVSSATMSVRVHAADIPCFILSVGQAFRLGIAYFSSLTIGSLFWFENWFGNSLGLDLETDKADKPSMLN